MDRTVQLYNKFEDCYDCKDKLAVVTSVGFEEWVAISVAVSCNQRKLWGMPLRQLPTAAL